jgi:hypothetical protein
MTTERLDIQVDDSQLNQLIGVLSRVANRLDEVGDEAKETSSQFKKLGNQLDDVKKGGQSFGTSLTTLGTNLGAAFGALKVAELGAQALTAAFDFASEGVTRFIATNVEAAARAESYTAGLNNLYLSIGQQIAQNPVFIQLQEKMIQLFAEAGNQSTALGRNLSTVLEGAINGVSLAFDFGNYLIEAWSRSVDFASGAIDIFATGILQIPTVLSIIGSGFYDLGIGIVTSIGESLKFALDKIKEFVDAVAPYSDAIGLPIDGLSRSLEGLSDNVDASVANLRQQQEQLRSDVTRQATDSYNAMAESIERKNRAFAEGAATYEATVIPATDQVTDANGRLANSYERVAEEATAAQQAMEPWDFTIEEGMDLTAESAVNRERTKQDALSRSRMQRLKDQGELMAQKAERDANMLKQATEESRLAQQEQRMSLATDGVNAGFSFGDAAVTRLMEGGANVGLDIGDALSGTIFSTLGQALPSILGVAGPWGAAISGGIGLIGSVVSGLFGRERRRRERDARAAAPVQQNSSTTVVLTNNFGLFSDRRSTAAAVSQATTEALRRGA